MRTLVRSWVCMKPSGQVSLHFRRPLRVHFELLAGVGRQMRSIRPITPLMPIPVPTMETMIAVPWSSDPHDITRLLYCSRQQPPVDRAPVIAQPTMPTLSQSVVCPLFTIAQGSLGYPAFGLDLGDMARFSPSRPAMSSAVSRG